MIVDVDESTEISLPSSNSQYQRDSTSNKMILRRETHEREHVNLPTVNESPSKHASYEYQLKSPNYNNSEYSYQVNSIDDIHQPSYHAHPRRRHHHLYRRDPKGGTYDPRWWYMPLNSVHGPKSSQHMNHHYTSRKWYELPSRH